MTDVSSRPATSQVSPDIQPLTVADVRSLRMPWDGRFSQREIEQIAGSEPNLSVWNQRTGEFLIGGRWRHRNEIATILELAGSAGAIDLLNGWAARCAERGIRLLIVSEQTERRRREFYEAAQFALTEEIVIYELSRVRARSPVLSGLQFEPFLPSDRRQFDELLALDHAAFPWLWWNCEDEFIQYASAPGVSIDLARDAAGTPAAYVGTTRYRSWGHLDRIAVAPGCQGLGLGRAALDYAVMTLAQGGARRIGLSTQAANTRSRRLYDAYGFRRSTGHDYRLYGRRLDPNEGQTTGGYE